MEPKSSGGFYGAAILPDTWVGDGQNNLLFEILKGYKTIEIITNSVFDLHPDGSVKRRKKNVKKVEKEVGPNSSAVIFALCNLGSPTYKPYSTFIDYLNRKEFEKLEKRWKAEGIFDKMSDEELSKYIEDGDKRFGSGSDQRKIAD